MFLVTTVTSSHLISIGLRQEQYGEVEASQTAILTPQEARAYASQLVSRAEIAERRRAKALEESAKSLEEGREP